MKERVAILGGGQLSYFLSTAARNLGLESVVITPNADSPATFAADQSVKGRLDTAQWHALLAVQDATITFEIDAISPALLDRLETIGNSATIAQIRALRLLQDKTTQKRWLTTQGFLTAPAIAFDGERHLAEEFVRAHGFPIVQKLARGGYDGQGVQVITDEKGLDHLWQVTSLLEQYVPFVQELTVLVARSTTGELKGYEPVATNFNNEGNLLDHLIAPAPIGDDLTSRARLLAEAVINRLDGVGIYAVELFLTNDNQLLVNEISARVHNTGNHTLEATATSQYEQHLRAILGWPLASTEPKGPVTVMRNLLNGKQTLNALADRPPHSKAAGKAVLHWYGKQADRYLRKMGHITATGHTEHEAWASIHALETRLGIRPNREQIRVQSDAA